ncbi:MAG: DoxX family protein [Planctomycetes bacterium]|nr:DoxX family protein [Planctomycetota bacterium]
MKNSTVAEDTGVLLIRLILGVAFLFHGSQKLFGAFDGPGMTGFTDFLRMLEVPMPAVSAWLAALAEFVGGLALISGAFLQIMMVPVAFTMFVAAFHVHWNDGWVRMEYPLVLGCTAIGLALIGPGRFAWRPRVAKS